MKHEHQPPRSRAIAQQVEQALRASGTPRRTYAANVAEIYMARTAEDERIVEFHAGTTIDSIDRAMKANDQIIGRYLDRVVKVMPADLEEAMVEALPLPHRDQLKSLLAARYGLLAAPIPHAGLRAPLASLAELLREQGEMIIALAPMFDDGRIDHTDKQHATRALREIGDVMSQLVGLQQQILMINE